MDFETHIQQLAAQSETVTWNIKKKNDSARRNIISDGEKDKNQNEHKEPKEKVEKQIKQCFVVENMPGMKSVMVEEFQSH